MADIDWKPLPTGLWTPPAVFAEVGNLFLQAFTDHGVPTWEISKKTEERGEWKVIAKGTADSFEAAKAAALFEATARRWSDSAFAINSSSISLSSSYVTAGLGRPDA